MSESSALLLSGGALVAGLALGGLVGWRGGLPAGVAAGCLTIGLGASVAAAGLAWERWRLVAASESIEGRLVIGDDGEPEVVFAAGGAAYRLRGAVVGRLKPKDDGDDRVPVRYPRGEPSRAVVADLPSLWGGALALGLFGALPLAMGAFMLGVAIDDRRPARRGGRLRDPRAAAWQGGDEHVEAFGSAESMRLPLGPRIGGNLTVAANFILLAAMAWLGFSDGEAGDFGRGFVAVAAGVGAHGVAFRLRRPGQWQGPAICFIIALGFALFGGLAWLLG